MIDRPDFDLDRRRLIELVGMAAGGVLLETALAGCSSVVRRDVDAEPASSTALPDLVAILLHEAALAPSSHNSQPWRVVVHDSTNLAIHADITRALADIDPAQRELRLSLGAFIENLVIAAEARALACRVDLADGDDLRQPVAEIRLTPGPPSGYPIDRLRRRCTVRRGLRPTSLPRSVIAALSAADPTTIHFVPAGGPVAVAIAEATLEAFRQQTARDSAQLELAHWMRFSNDAARAHRDGLTTASLGITGLSGWYVRHFYDDDDVMTSGFRDRSIDLTASQLREGAGWFVVTSRDAQPASIVDAGRVFQRLGLLACDRGVGLHPMSQALEESPYRGQLVDHLGVAGVPQFVVRAGLVDTYPAPTTLRRPVGMFASAPVASRANRHVRAHSSPPAPGT